MQNNNQNTVYIVNFSSHDFSPAKEYGKLEVLSKGNMSPFNYNGAYREFTEKLKNSKPGDYILKSGYTHLNMIAAAIMTYMHGRINVLFWKDGEYKNQTMVIGNLINSKLKS